MSAFAKHVLTEHEQLNEVFNTPPYEVEMVKKSERKIFFQFEDDGTTYAIQFFSSAGLGKNVRRVHVVAKQGNSFREVIKKFSNPTKIISTLLHATEEYLKTPIGKKVDGFVFDVGVKISPRAVPLLKRVVRQSKLIKQRLTIVDTNVTIEEGREMVFMVKKGKDPAKVFDGEKVQGLIPSIDDTDPVVEPEPEPSPEPVIEPTPDPVVEPEPEPIPEPEPVEFMDADEIRNKLIKDLKLTMVSPSKGFRNKKRLPEVVVSYPRKGFDPIIRVAGVQKPLSDFNNAEETKSWILDQMETMKHVLNVNLPVSVDGWNMEQDVIPEGEDYLILTFDPVDREEFYPRYTEFKILSEKKSFWEIKYKLQKQRVSKKTGRFQGLKDGMSPEFELEMAEGQDDSTGEDQQLSFRDESLMILNQYRDFVEGEGVKDAKIDEKNLKMTYDKFREVTLAMGFDQGRFEIRWQFNKRFYTSDREEAVRWLIKRFNLEKGRIKPAETAKDLFLGGDTSVVKKGKDLVREFMRLYEIEMIDLNTDQMNAAIDNVDNLFAEYDYIPTPEMLGKLSDVMMQYTGEIILFNELRGNIAKASLPFNVMRLANVLELTEIPSIDRNFVRDTLTPELSQWASEQPQHFIEDPVFPQAVADKMREIVREQTGIFHHAIDRNEAQARDLIKRTIAPKFDEDKFENYMISLIDNSSVSAEEAIELTDNILSRSRDIGSKETNIIKRELPKIIRVAGGNLKLGKFIKDKPRAYYSEREGDGMINVGNRFNAETLWHEVGHSIEKSDSMILKASRDILLDAVKRVEDRMKPVRDMGETGTGVRNEWALYDPMFDTYAGRLYYNQDFIDDNRPEDISPEVHVSNIHKLQYTEVLSMAIQYFHSPNTAKYLFVRDPELFDFVRGLMENIN